MSSTRQLPPGSAIAVSPQVGTTTFERPGTVTLPPGQIRLIGAAWTFLPERLNPEGKPQAFDYRSDEAIACQSDLAFLINGRESRYLGDDGGSVGAR